MYTGFVSDKLADKIETYVTKNNDDLPWVYCEETTGYVDGYYDSIAIPGSGETFQFEHRILSETYGIVDRKAWSEIMFPLMMEYQEHNFPPMNDVFRSKINMLTIDPRKEITCHTPHVDDVDPHWVMIYYINDSDGPTIFFDQHFDGQKKAPKFSSSVKPRKGKFVIFDGLQYHASSAPRQTTQRCVININFR